MTCSALNTLSKAFWKEDRKSWGVSVSQERPFWSLWTERPQNGSRTIRIFLRSCQQIVVRCRRYRWQSRYGRIVYVSLDGPEHQSSAFTFTMGLIFMLICEEKIRKEVDEKATFVYPHLKRIRIYGKTSRHKLIEFLEEQTYGKDQECGKQQAMRVQDTHHRWPWSREESRCCLRRTWHSSGETRTEKAGEYSILRVAVY